LGAAQCNDVMCGDAQALGVADAKAPIKVATKRGSPKKLRVAIEPKAARRQRRRGGPRPVAIVRLYYLSSFDVRD
jgi:hypothetical protein